MSASDDAAAGTLTAVVETMEAARPHVLVIGDAMLDTYVGGTVDRISPEAPVPVVRVISEGRSLGGAANVAHQVSALGATVDLIAIVGDDAPGDEVRASCAELGIGTVGLTTVPGRRTTTKERITVGRQQIARLDRETDEVIDGATEQHLLTALDGARRPDAVVVSDYAKGVLTDAVLDAVIGAGRRWGVPILVDPKHPDFGRYRGATVIKANLAEFRAAIGGGGVHDIDTEVGTRGRDLLAACGIDHLIVTVGADGMVVLRAGDGPVTLPTAAREVYDVSGAGDTVIATLAIAIASGADLLIGAEIANVAAGVAVQRRGVAVVSAADLAAAVDDDERPPTDVVTRARLSALTATWRSEGRRIVFTNGCFDLFHAGHVHLLGAARALGDVLVVAIDSDESVRRLKGSSRPIIAGTQRMAIVGALGCVDAVVPFDSDELESLIAEVMPDVLVKGADYRLDQVVGADIVTGNGGTVALIPLVDDVSTSAVVGRIRDV